jgi:hypothetical protein
LFLLPEVLEELLLGGGQALLLRRDHLHNLACRTRIGESRE